MSPEFNVRALGPHEWWAFRQIRLEALQTSPENFGTSYEAEAALHDQTWVARIIDPKGKIFGMFDQGDLIGLNGVFTDQHDPDGKTALLGMWYMRESYRGQGLFNLLAQVGVNWAEKQERFDRIHVRHREGNHASENNIKKAGFTMVDCCPRTWPDGEVANICIYERIFER